LGIRIIAPNQEKEQLVSRCQIRINNRFDEKVLAQPNFKKQKLPIALGKTISSETFVVDLAR
jgi:DNA segregation ATPase FtsK/SpoIIIE-like protein